MAKRIPVGDGWVTLREPRMVPERLRRPIVAKASTMQRIASSLSEDSVSEDHIGALFSFNDLVAVALIMDWSWDSPVAVESLLDLPGADYDAIQKLVAPMLTDLMPSFEPTPDADSPTVASVE